MSSALLTRAGISLPSSIRCYSIASREYMRERRRELNKSNLKTPSDNDANYLRFPDQRLGNNYDLNWKLLEYGVTALGTNAFRNLHQRHLEMYTPAQLGSSKSLVLKGDRGTNHTTYFASSPHATVDIPSEVPLLTFEVWNKLMAGVTRTISESDSIFVTDAAIGSHGNVRTNVRVFSSDPGASLYLRIVDLFTYIRHMLSPAPGYLQTFKHPVVVLHSPDYVPKDYGRYQMKDGSFSAHFIMTGSAVLDAQRAQHVKGLSDDVLNEIVASETSVVIVGGTPSLSVLRDAIVGASEYVHLRNNQLPLSNAYVLSNTKGTSSLIFDNSGTFTSKPMRSDMFAAENCLWATSGLYRSFQGVSLSDTSTANRGDIVELFPDGEQLVTMPLTRQNNSGLFSQHPKALVFVVNEPDLPAFGRTTPEIAVQLFPKYLNTNVIKMCGQGPKDEIKSSLFASLLNESSPSIFIINKGKASNFENLLDMTMLSELQIPSGSVQLEKGEIVQPITKVPGMEASSAAIKESGNAASKEKSQKKANSQPHKPQTKKRQKSSKKK